MIQKIKLQLLLLMSTIMMTAAPLALAPAISYAACSNIGNQVQSGANIASSSNGTNSGPSCDSDTGVQGSDLASIASKVVNIFSLIVGAVAVIMIIYGGFRYITSGGDSGSVGNAKNTLIYAIVGLIIVALAQLIVHFVLNTSSSAVSQ